MILVTSKIFKKGSVGIIKSKISKKIGGNNYIENIQKDRWEYRDQKIFKESTTKLSSLNV